MKAIIDNRTIAETLLTEREIKEATAPTAFSQIPDIVDGHMMTIGASGTGKTWAAVALANAVSRKLSVIAFIPDINDQKRFYIEYKQYQRNNKIYLFDELEPFIDCIKNSRDCFVIWDEITSTYDNKLSEHREIPTYARHWGHQILFIAHRYTNLHPTIRSCCNSVIMFRINGASHRQAADDYAIDEPDQVRPVNKFEFTQFQSCKTPKLKKLFKV